MKLFCKIPISYKGEKLQPPSGGSLPPAIGMRQDNHVNRTLQNAAYTTFSAALRLCAGKRQYVPNP